MKHSLKKLNSPIDRMPMVRKPKPEIKKIIPPKREVLSRDILSKPKPRLKIKSVIHGHGTVWQAPVNTTRVTSSRPYSWQTLSYVTACLLMGVFSLHALSYLDTARSASGRVLGDATSAYDELNAASESLGSQDFSGAKTKFKEAQSRLIQAQDAFDSIRLLALVAPPARSADNILTGAYFLAEAGKNLATAVQLFDELSVTSEGISTENWTEKLRDNHQLLQNSLMMLNFAEEKFNSISGLPQEYDQTLVEAKSQIKALKSVLNDLIQLEDLFLAFFGTEPKTYLLVFQNYDEIRATGGFIGTYGVLKYENGNISDLKIESIYNIDGSLTKLIAAPGPFQPEIKKWALRDSNWFADFPSSARKMLEFFEMESETADGVIALTPRIFSDILKMIGPVSMPQYGVTLTAENFQDVVQEQTSEFYDRKLNQPKKFLDDFAPVLLNRLGSLGKEQWFNMFQIIQDNFSQRHIMVYSPDTKVQEKIVQLGFDGGILNAEHDYLSVVNSNLGGTKTDLDIRQSIFYQSNVSADGTITNTVRVVRQNTSDMVNRNYMRVLVPQGSTLVSASGLAEGKHNESIAEGYEYDKDLQTWDKSVFIDGAAIKNEAGKTVFAGWTETAGQETSTITFQYVLPFQLKQGTFAALFNRSLSHSLLFQKQPGNLATYVEGEWNFEKFETAWASPGSVRSETQVKFNAIAETDQFWGVVVK